MSHPTNYHDNEYSLCMTFTNVKCRSIFNGCVCTYVDQAQDMAADRRTYCPTDGVALRLGMARNSAGEL
jgi:hypothetical protein